MADSTRRNRRGYDCALQRIRDGRWVIDPEAATIWSAPAGRLLNPGVSRWGYRMVSIWDPKFKTRRMIFLHRVVWESVHGPIDDPHLEINHMDGDKLNNSLCNLELVTPFENTWHAARLGLINGRLPQPGDEHSIPDPTVTRNHVRLTAAQVIEIRVQLSQGATQKSVAGRYGVSQAQISKIWRGDSWARVPAVIR